MLFLNLFFSFLIAFEVVLFLDSIIIFGNRILPLKVCFLCYAFVFGIVFITNWFWKLYRTLAFSQVILFTVLLIVTLWFFLYQYKETYKSPNKKTACLFHEKTIMVIVPHQDDELNLMGAELYRQLIENKNRLITVFVTNGDYLNKGTKRIKEAIKVNRKLGVRKEDVIFLGYGGGWAKECPNIYNGEGKGILTSHCGKAKTYGVPNHPAFHDGTDYTTENFFGDIKSVILSIRPDVIFCSDYDCQQDHAMVSLGFEKVMGEILKQGSGYTPRVFKGFCYPTAWTAPNDFYNMTIRSTLKIGQNETGISSQYEWGNRVRLPVYGLSRSIFGCKTFYSLKQYRSQSAFLKAPRIINGDKVFWERRTDSALNHAKIAVSSGCANHLSDFMLLNCDNIKENHRIPYNGAWIPDTSDKEKKITIEFACKTNVYSVKLYGNIHPDSKVLETQILLDNGQTYCSGEIMSCGTELQIDQKGIEKMEIVLLDTKGEYAGISEIEVFENPQPDDNGYIKLCNNEDDFLYDVITDRSTFEMNLYTYHALPLNAQNYTIFSNDKRITCHIENGSVIVKTSAALKGVLTVQSKNGKFSDTISFRRVTPKKMNFLNNLLKFDARVFDFYKVIAFNHLFRRGFESFFEIKK